MQGLSGDSLVKLEQQIFGEKSSLDDANDYLKDLYVEVELPVLRKLFAAVYIVRASAFNQADHEARRANQEKLSEICAQTSDQEELRIIK